jgi:hypothetical protein
MPDLSCCVQSTLYPFEVKKDSWGGGGVNLWHRPPRATTCNHSIQKPLSLIYPSREVVVLSCFDFTHTTSTDAYIKYSNENSTVNNNLSFCHKEQGPNIFMGFDLLFGVLVRTQLAETLR